jgi:hypothetical protein
VPAADVVLTPAPPDKPGWLETEMAREYAQVHDAAIADPFKPYTNEEFEASIAALVDFARSRSAFVRRQLEVDRTLHPARK